VNREQRALEVHSGLSYFDRAQEIVLAPSFTLWREVNLGSLPARSKQSLRGSLKKASKEFRAETHGGYALLAAKPEASLGSESFNLFVSIRQALNARDAVAFEQLKKVATPSQYSELCRLAELGESNKDEDELESLLDSLGADGAFAGTSSFSLNQNKALQKLTDFQLGERHLFPLFLTAGLSLMGAESIRVELDSDEIWVHFEGTHFDKKTLHKLTSLILGDASTSVDRGLKKIAQALLQGAGHKPSILQLQIGSSVVDLKSFPEIPSLDKLDPGPQSGLFYSKLPLSLSVATRYLKSLKSGHSEVDKLSHSLGYLPTPWSLNGETRPLRLPLGKKSLVFEWCLPGQALEPVRAEECLYKWEQESPVPAHILMILNPTSPGQLTIINDGLRAECPPETQIPQTPLQIYLWLSDMRTDLSGLKLVQTQLLDEIVETVSTLQERVPNMIAEAFFGLPESERNSWQEPLLYALTKGYDELGDLPFLKLIGQTELTALSQLRPELLTYCTTQDFEAGLRSGEPVLKLTPESLAFMRELRACQDATADLESARQYYVRLEEWLQTPQEEPVLKDSKLKLSLRELDGEIGFGHDPEPSARVLCKKRPVPIQMDHLVPGYVKLVVNHDGLEMNDSWSQAWDPKLVRSIGATLQQNLRRLLTLLSQQDMRNDEARKQMTEALSYLARNGHSVEPWSDLKFIEETRVELDTSQTIPVPRQIVEYFSLKERPNYLKG